ncbi:MAG: type IV pilus modification PilV family protein [Minisyncoccota bacterium]
MKRYATNFSLTYAKHARHRTAFTLIETMIAITILTLAVSGPLFIASRTILAANVSRDQLTASYLAQEGVEYVRAMRDDEYLAAYQICQQNPNCGINVTNVAWNNFLTGSMPSNPGAVTQCRSTACTLDPLGYPAARPMGYGTTYALNGFSGPVSPLYLAGGIFTQQNSSGATLTPFRRTVQVETVTGAPTDSLGNPADVRIVSTVSWDSHGTPYQVTVTDHLTPWQ